MIENFLLGLIFPLRGLKQIFSSRLLLGLSVIPLIIDIILFWVGLSMGAPFIDSLVLQAMAQVFSVQEGFWYQLLYYPVLVMFWLVFVAGVSLIIYFLASIIASPFNGLLAERTLILKGLLADEKFNLINMTKNSLNMFKVSILRALLLIPLGLLLFVCSFIPGLNLVAAYCAFILIAFDSADYSFEARKFSLKQRFQYFKDKLSIFLGMGVTIGIFALIPGLLLLAMPSMVVGFAEVISTVEGRKS